MVEGLQAGCFLPLVSRDRVLGVLAAFRRSNNPFMEDDALLFEQVAQQVAIAVESELHSSTKCRNSEFAVFRVKLRNANIRARFIAVNCRISSKAIVCHFVVASRARPPVSVGSTSNCRLTRGLGPSPLTKDISRSLNDLGLTFFQIPRAPGIGKRIALSQFHVDRQDCAYQT
jgi:GAF domain